MARKGPGPAKAVSTSPVVAEAAAGRWGVSGVEERGERARARQVVGGRPWAPARRFAGPSQMTNDQSGRRREATMDMDNVSKGNPSRIQAPVPSRSAGNSVLETGPVYVV